MVKTLSFTALFLLALSILPSCKKCYTCVNTCSSCILLDTTTHAIIAQEKVCSDSTSYNTIKDSLTTLGFTCTNAPATYHDDWCVNTKSAVNQYLPYHEGNGAYTCTPK